MEEGELTDEDNVSCETISSIGSVYFEDGSDSVYCNKSKSLDSSTVNSMLQKTTDPRPTSCDPINFKPTCFSNTWISKELTGTTTVGEERLRLTLQTKDGKHYTNKDKENCIDTRAKNFADRLLPKETELINTHHTHSDQARFLKRKHNENDVEFIESHEKRKKKRRRRGKRFHDHRGHHRNSSSLEESAYHKRDSEKLRNRHGAKHKKSGGQKKHNDLLHRVISKSGPSQDPLISGCAENSLMKKLVGSGSLIVKSNSVSSDLKCEIGSMTSISSPDMDMFEDLHFSSSDPDTEGDLLIITESEVIDSEGSVCNKTEQQRKKGSITNSLESVSDDSEIEVIIPEKKLPPLVVLHSDGEEEVVENYRKEKEFKAASPVIVCDVTDPLLTIATEISNPETGKNSSEENIDKEENMNTDDVEVNVNMDNIKETQNVDVPNSESNAEEEDDDDYDDDDDDILKLRMIALKSSKDKSKLDNNKVQSETESQSEDNVTDKNVEVTFGRRPSYEEEDDLKLRAEALKSAFLRKHSERLKKGIHVKKGTTKKLKDTGRRSSVNSPVSITSPLSATNSCEFQGEEDMEIAESDVEGEIVEVNNVCESTSIDKWNELDATNYPIITNQYQEYHHFTLSKHILEYSQPLPPGVDPVASSNPRLDTFCSSQFASKHLTPPPLIPILSLPPPPPPPPLPPLSPLPSLKNDLLVINTNQNVTEFVQSGNEFSVHHSVPVFGQDITHAQCTQLSTQFYNTTFQAPENCSSISKSPENNFPLTASCLPSQDSFIGNQTAHVTNTEHLTASYFNNLDSSINVGHSQPQELLINPAQNLVCDKFGKTGAVGPRQNIKSRPNLLQVPINKTVSTNLKSINAVPLGSTEQNKETELPNNQEEFSGKSDERPNATIKKNNINVSDTSKQKINMRRKMKKLRRTQKKEELSRMIFNLYFEPSQEKSNREKEGDDKKNSSNNIVTFENSNSKEIVNNAELIQNKNKYFQDSEVGKTGDCGNFDIINSSVLKTCNSDTTDNFILVGDEQVPDVGNTEKNVSEVDNSKENVPEIDYSKENVGKSSNTESNEESDIDLSEMIVLDEVGMSPEHMSKLNCDESKEIEITDDNDDDDEDVEILRAKALTSISSKVIDLPRISINPNKNSFKNHVDNRVIQGNNPETTNKTFAYINPKNIPEKFMLNRTSELGEKSRYRFSRVVNIEPVRSVVKGKLLKVVIPSDGPVVSPNILTMAQVSPPQVPRLVINVGQDSDTDNECDEWSRKVIIRSSENKHLDEESAKSNADVEKSVEMFLSDVRRQHENTLHSDNRIVQFDESLELNQNKLSVHFDDPVKKLVPAVTEFNVTGVLPSTRTPIKRLSTTDATPVRLLTLTKQKEYHMLKQELADMERLRQQKPKVPVNAKLKPNNSPLRYAVLSEMHKKSKETTLNSIRSSERTSPVKKSTERLLVPNSPSLEQSVNTAETKAAVNVSPSVKVKSPEVGRMEAPVKVLEKAEKELLSERYTVIDELTEMNNFLGDFERAQEKLTSNQTEVIRLRKELLAAELKLQNQMHIVSDIQNDFFATHAKMISGTLSCEQWEKTCSKLGSQVNGIRYEIPNSGKKLLMKKLQQVSERTSKLKIKVKSLSHSSFKSKSSTPAPEIQPPVSKTASESQSVQTVEQMETCEVSVIPEVGSQNTDDQSSVKQPTLNSSEIFLNDDKNDETSKESSLPVKNDNSVLPETVSKEALKNVNDVSVTVAAQSVNETVSKEALKNVNDIRVTFATCSVNETVLKDGSDRTQHSVSEQVTVPCKVQDNSTVVPERTLKSQNKVSSYVSPLQHFGISKSGKKNIDGNPQDILCQFDLMGKCLDDSCQYKHHTKSS